MRILKEDVSSGTVRVQVETDEDLWHLYNVGEEGDVITASTTRREEKAADKLRAERAEKKRMTLGVRIEKIEFSEDDLSRSVTDEIIAKKFDSGMKVTDEEGADQYMTDTVPGTLVSYVVAPTDPVHGSYCYKMLIDSETNKLYYFRRQKRKQMDGNRLSGYGYPNQVKPS